jgi:predicted transcriptional regulator
MAGKSQAGRVTGAQRQELTASLVEQYAAGASIRELASSTGRSYGFIHRLLTDGGAQLRGRGGATRNRAGRLAAG